MTTTVAASNAPPGRVKISNIIASNSAAPVDTVSKFYMEDFGKTLFPLKTNRELIVRGEAEIKEYITNCLDKNRKDFAFLSQKRVYAAKPNFHLRRTVKLDPVAEYYIYDLVFRNRQCFRKPHSPHRTHYGYRFESGSPISPTTAYKAFKTAIAEYSAAFKNSMKFDVASYFNGVYHHDITGWFAELGASDEDAAGLGQLLRQINSGRSIDCLPQGIYPTKMMGNDFLRFIDDNHSLKSEKFIRFMDDMYIFSDSEKAILDDFQVIQRLLGEKGLSVNPQKTFNANRSMSTLDTEIDDVKKKLLARRRLLVLEGYDELGEEIIKEYLLKSPLADDELKYINNILDKPEIEEEDVELILTIMIDHTEKVEKRIPYIINKYPHLIKSVHSFCSRIADRETIAGMILSEVISRDRLMEYQIFWFGAILEDYLMNTSKAGLLIDALFYHRSSTTITKAKILEIADNRFGLSELRHEFLVSGSSDWLAWASAVGSRSLKATTRNYRLKYFGNHSQINHLIANIMMK